MSPIHHFTVYDIEGTPRGLAEFRGQVLLVVNVASACRFTPQYVSLEGLYQAYRAQGFTVLAFPCNQFGYQERGEDSQIQNFCTRRYQISFPLFAKIAVNGPRAHPLYQWLKKEKRGIFGTAAIKWNFTKFLIGRDGNVIGRYASTQSPWALAPHIEQALRKGGVT